MELVFSKIENDWVAEFEAPGDFNLHLERKSTGSLVISQRGTASGEYSAAFAKGIYEGQKVIDYDFGALVYPKWIKVESSSEVVSASVNFNEGWRLGSGSGLKYLPKYYSIDWSVADEGWSTVFTSVFMSMVSTLKINGMIFAYTTNDINAEAIDAFSYLPVALKEHGASDTSFFETLESVIDYENRALSASISMNGIKEISEEEYYSFDNNNVPSE